MDTNSLPLHQYHVHKLWASLNQTYSLLQTLALLTIFYYRASFFFNKPDPKNHTTVASWVWIVVFASELLLSFLWILRQPVYWRPVTRTAFPERLPKDEEEMGKIDVFICTADPEKEPTFEVMNTVISAMSLEYPYKKLSVYLSDDGGAFVTLNGMKEAWVFATWWLPFVNKYNIKPPCPLAYFEKEPKVEESCDQSKEFFEDRKKIKEKYEVFKQRVQNKMRGDEVVDDAKISSRDRPALIQVINGKSIEVDASLVNQEYTEMPLLVYVAREKKSSHPHHFKAGALNVLLRVSSTLGNSPYILVLDCDMYCNDSISAHQAMCFHLDPKISPTLGWVQFPQKFHNISDSDIYDSQMRTVWPVLWRGVDGLQGPPISGTNFYIKREALYGINANGGINLIELRDSFGPSNDFIKSLSQYYTRGKESSPAFLEEAKYLASCSYEKGTQWGEKVGFRYDTIVEDARTSLYLQSKGWKSVYLNPTRPQFLGSATTNLDDLLAQGIRWYSGLVGIGLSKYCPLIHSPSRLQFLQKMFLSWLVLFPLEALSNLCLATIAPLCFLYGISLYPKVSDPVIIAFAFAMISSQVKYLCEVRISGGSTRAWLNEHRVGMVKSVTCYLYGSIDVLMTKLGAREASFIPTNKAGDDDKFKYYQLGMYDFRTSNMLLVPLVTLVTLNLVCFIGGVVRMMVAQNWDGMFVQVVLLFYLLVMSFPVIEGMVLRMDNGRVPSLTTLISLVVSLVLLVLGYFTILH